MKLLMMDLMIGRK